MINAENVDIGFIWKGNIMIIFLNDVGIINNVHKQNCAEIVQVIMGIAGTGRHA